MNHLFMVLIQENGIENNWENLLLCESYEQAEEVIRAHYKEYYCFKIEKIFKGEKWLIDDLK